jgi:hypothetical protein
MEHKYLDNAEPSSGQNMGIRFCPLHRHEHESYALFHDFDARNDFSFPTSLRLILWVFLSYSACIIYPLCVQLL